MFSETDMLGAEVLMHPWKLNVKLLPYQGEILDDPGRYLQLVGKLNYLTVIRPDIAFSVSIVSQFLLAPRTTHWDVVVQIL